MAEEEAIGLMQQLARDFNVRDPRKLYQIARREFPGRADLTSARAAAALRGDVARQVLAPKPRSLGKSAAEGPNDRLQADLIDFAQNTRGPNKFGLVVTDVFTREVATKALPDKSAQTVTRAAAEIIPQLVQDETNIVVTTDLGNEFRGLEAALPGGAVHRQKDPTDRNATAVVDRAIQTLKKDLAGEVARHGGGWGDHAAAPLRLQGFGWQHLAAFGWQHLAGNIWLATSELDDCGHERTERSEAERTENGANEAK
eukprot:s10700_g2.t1